jgi:hypothetical protein
MPRVPAKQTSPHSVGSASTPSSTPLVKVWPRWLSRQEAAAYLREAHGMRYGPGALANAACEGSGPKFSKQGGKLVSYLRDDLDEFAKLRMSDRVRSTSELRDGKAA